VSLTATSHRLLKKIRDDKFDEDRIGQYHLALLTGPHDLQVLVYEPESRRALWLEDYVFPSVNQDEDWQASLQELFNQHPFLLAGFWKQVMVGVKTPQFVQHPHSLFAETDARACLAHNAYIEPNSEVQAFAIPNAGLVTIFALPSVIKRWFTLAYPSTQLVFTHQSCALIQGLIHERAEDTENPLYIYVDRFRLHIMAATPEGLRYYNQFAIHHFNEYIHYIMLVMHTLGMDQQKAKVVMWGYVGKNSPHYHEFYKYIRTLTYGHRPASLTYGYVFDELQDHQYFDMLNMPRLHFS
jgi:hypothetical protein